jgi:hypothetical protein
VVLIAGMARDEGREVERQNEVGEKGVKKRPRIPKMTRWLRNWCLAKGNGKPEGIQANFKILKRVAGCKIKMK